MPEPELDQIFNQKICYCYHSLDEEHLIDKCYALDYNGTTYSACPCTKPKILPFRLTFKIEIPNEHISVNASSESKTTKPTKRSTESAPQIAASISNSKIDWGKRTA